MISQKIVPFSVFCGIGLFITALIFAQSQTNARLSKYPDYDAIQKWEEIINNSNSEPELRFHLRPEIADDLAPPECKLNQNYPNPFNLETTIEYQLPHSGAVVLKILNLLGQEVKNLVEQEKTGGNYRAIWDGTDNSGKYVDSGIYVITLQAGEFIQTRKLIVLKQRKYRTS